MRSTPPHGQRSTRRPSLPRRIRRAALAALSLCAAWPSAAAAQSAAAGSPVPESFVHESWTVADGLPVNSVTSLVQSRDGYLWIGTFDGLVRFDGVRFTVFNTANSPGLPSSRIVDLQETRDGALWLRTSQTQLVRFQHGVFTHFGPDRGLSGAAWTFVEDANGRFWVGTDEGVSVIQDERVVPVAAEAIRGRVRAIHQRRDGSIGVGTADGRVFRIEGGAATLVVPEGSLPAAEIWALQEERDGTLWIGLDVAGIWRHRGTAERVLAQTTVLGFDLSPRTGALWSVTAHEVLRFGPDGPRPVVSRSQALFRPQRLVRDGEGWMLYSSGAELHREGRRIYTLPGAAGRLSDEAHAITAILPDREGSIWLGTAAAGLHRIKLADFAVYGEPEGLSHRNVYSVYESRSGALWVGTLDGGTNRVAGGRITRMAQADGYPITAFSFLEDRAGRLWIGGGDGLHLCARPGERCARQGGGPIPPFGVRAIHEEPDGGFWFGSETGLFRLQDGRWTRLTAADGAPGATVRVFRRTRDGALWMGTDGAGLARYQDGRFTRVGTAEGLPLDLVRALHEDEDGWLWVGTEGRGVARLDPREWGPGRAGGRIVGYRAQDGLFDEGIHQILEDGFGRLWMSTNRGIFWVRRQELLDFAAGRVPRINSISYTERDGLRNREANGGSQPAGVRTRDGRLWFATQDGVAVVDPARIRPNPLPPRVVIEQVTAGGSVLPVLPGAALRLGVEQRDLEIDFTALSFLAPANVRFRYRLEGYDREWVEAGGRRTAFYTQVPPGRYTFRVIASNNDGVWNDDGAALALELAPRFRETGAFRRLLALTLALAVAGGVFLRVRGLRARSRELERLVAARTAELEREKDVTARQAEALQELDRAKSHFFANVSHEFRTPLTLTIGPLEDLHAAMRGDGQGAMRRQLEMALRNARRLLRLVNQILDVARLEAGEMKLRARRQDLAGFARGVAAAFAPVAERKQIDFETVAPAEEVPVWFDADALEKVLGNLLSNAFKFTPDGGCITLEVEAGAGEARLRVRDSGPGIPPEHLPYVFERFFQVDETTTRAQPGTGIGLALAKELVELHGGSVAVGSPPLPPSPTGGEGGRAGTLGGAPPLPSWERGQGGEGGAVFTVTLPLGRAHLRDDQLAPDAEAEDGRVVEDPRVTEDGKLAVRVELATPPRGEEGDAGRGEDVTTLLVVDDSADLRAYVRSHFEARYRVVDAADGAEGIALARRLLPDLVISDVTMPGTDGYELCRTLKGDPETDFIPVILLTARAATDDRVTGLRGGADDYLGKPFEMRELGARVENLIASRRRLRERFAAERPAAAPVEVAVATATEASLAPADRAWVERLQAAVDAHLDDPDFGVAELARVLFVDRTHLFRRTRQLLGESPSDLIRRMRLERAAPLLREGAGGIGEVAYGVGFNSVSHFCRCFRERFGVSPSEFRAGSAAPP